MTDTPETAPPEHLSEGAARRASRLATPRLQRETRAMAAMLRLYCADRHIGAALDGGGLRAARSELDAYTHKRLAGCPFGADKPTCANCRIHCNDPHQREQTRVVMRHAGPRMLWHHPMLAPMHLLVDSRRPAPPKPRGVVVHEGANAASRDRKPG